MPFEGANAERDCAECVAAERYLHKGKLARARGPRANQYQDSKAGQKVERRDIITTDLIFQDSSGRSSL